MTITALFYSIFGFFGCQKKHLVADLAREKEFARKIGDVLVHEYMDGETDDWRGWGWSRSKRDGRRMAVYPSSRLRFIADDPAPLHLYLKCRTYTQDDVAARRVRFELNDRKIASVDLKEGEDNFIHILLPEEDVQRGNNWIELFYIPGNGESRVEPLTPEGKRKFSLAVTQVVLSSYADREFADRYIRTKGNLSPHLGSGMIVQKVPGALDFYLDIPEKSFIEAECTFYPTNAISSSDDGFDLEISVQKPEEKEETIFSRPVDAAMNRITLDSPLSDSGGISKLRLKAGNAGDTGSLKGFLIWERARVAVKEKKKESATASDALSRYRGIFADKNFLFVIFDAARADHFSSYGYFRPTTPHVDRFARDSLVFTHAFSEALSTRCSMGTLFTGYPLTVTSLTKVTSGLPRELTTLAQHFRSQGFKTTGYTGIGNVASVFRFDRGFDQYFELYKEVDFYRKSFQYLPYVLPWLDANKDRKFFLYIHFKEPHAVYKPLPPFLGMFSGDYEERVDLTAYHEAGQELTSQQVEYIRACYDENLASADSAFGEILKKLKDLGLADKTIVILTADHGDLLGENGRRFGHGDYFGEGVMHIPLFIRIPGRDNLPVPGKIDSLVKMSDLFATLADGYAFDVPKDLIGGKSLLPVISGLLPEANPYIVVEKRDRKGFCIRTKKYKLIYWNDAPAEFYDLEEDPSAENNIYRQESVMAHYMMTELKKWVAAQELVKNFVLGEDAADRDIEFDEIDKRTLDNLKALGYIK